MSTPTIDAAAAQPAAVGDANLEDLEAANRKISRRLVSFLFCLYVIAFLDRINFGFAAVSMNRDLGLTAATFGLAGTIMYIGYFALEVPSNMLMVKFGARRWICRIMVTWGLATMATALATGPAGLYITRLIVGMAEAGFLPGILLYLTYWTPNAQRARVMSFFMIAQPIAIGFGSLISGMIMQQGDGVWGFTGWQWLFAIEGFMAVVAGAAALFYLPDTPNDARWLTAPQRQAITTAISSDPVRRHRHTGNFAQFCSPTFILVALCYFALVTGLNALSTWSPLILQEVITDRSNYLHIGLLSAIPGVVAAIAMPLWGRSSDKRGERGWHYAIAALVGVLGWITVISIDSTAGRVFGLMLATAGGFSAMPILWTLPPSILSPSARPVGLAVLSMTGILGSVTSPSIMGVLRESTGDFNSGIWYVAVLLGTSAVVFLAVSRRLAKALNTSDRSHAE